MGFPGNRLILAALFVLFGLGLCLDEAAARPMLIPVSRYTSFDPEHPDQVGSPALSPDGTRIAFIHSYDPLGSNLSALPRLFVVRTDGTGLSQVSGDFDTPATPVWSLDGSSIYFTARLPTFGHYEIFRRAANGGPVQRLTFQDDETGLDRIRKIIPSTAETIYFASASDLLREGFEPGNNERNVYRLADQGFLFRVTDRALHLIRNAEVLGVSADGSLVAYVAEDPGLPSGRPMRPFVIRTATGAIDPLTPEFGSQFIEGGMSAIGGQVLFASSADYLGTNGGRRPQIFRAGAIDLTLEQMTDVQTPGALNPAVDGAGARFIFETRASILVNETTGTSRVYTQAGDDFRRVSTGYTGSISLDGSRIAYVDDTDSVGFNADLSPEIFSVRPDGTDRRQHSLFVPGMSHSPDISTNGDRVVFLSSGNLDGGNSDGSPEVYTVKTDGTGLVRLTDTPHDRECRDPSLSPGGDFVVFASNGELVPGENFDLNFEIFRIRTDGSELTQISRSSTGANGSPVVSAFGDTVAYISTANVVLGASLGEGRVAVWRASGGTTLVTPISDRAIDRLLMDDQGSQIVLLTQANLDNRNLTHVRRPFTVTLTGGSLRALNLPGAVQIHGLGLSPDGAWLSAALDSGILTLLPSSGGTADTLLAEPGVYVTQPVLSRNAAQVAFSVLGTGGVFVRGDYYVLERSTGDVTALIGATQPRLPDSPALSGDGRKIAFVMSSADTLNQDGSVEVFVGLIVTTPVFLYDFSAVVEEDGVSVRWSVDPDSDPAFFQVERGPDREGPFQIVASNVDGPGPSFVFVDRSPPRGTLWYRLAAFDRMGDVDRFGPLAVHVSPPRAPRLKVFPNPFHPSTTVSFDLPRAGHIELRIIDVAGRRVRNLFRGPAPEGHSEMTWDGKDDHGTNVASGVYYVILNDGPARKITRAR